MKKLFSRALIHSGLVTKSTASADQEGQSMVEFTLAFPMFLGVMLGLAAMSLIFYSYLTVTLSSREGASAIVHNPRLTVAQVQATVQASSISLNPSALTVSVEPSDTSTWVSGLKVSVTAAYTVPVPTFAIPSLRGNRIILFGPFSLQATSNMTID